MNPSDGDDAKRRARREADAANARRRRAERRAARESAYRDAQATRPNVVSFRVPPGAMLEEHLQIVSQLVREIVADPMVSKIEKANIAIKALVPMARALETTEFRDRLADLERRVGLRSAAS